jgi:tRNA(Arg) A34 adenosine deaminase TadA
VEAWRKLEPAWRAAFELAWEALRARTIPVGAVVTRGDEIIARGRNRIFETTGPQGQVFASRVAHAEVNALVQLPVTARYYDCTLWTTLEPCAQCIGSAWVCTIGSVNYAGPDVYAGAAKMIERDIERAETWRTPMEVSGPIDGPFGVLGELLHVAFFVAERPDAPAVPAFRERIPNVVALAERLRLHEHAAAPLEEALPRFLDEL